MTEPLHPKRSLARRLASRYLMPTLRLSLFGSALVLVLVGVLAHQARAQLGEVLMGIGVEMLRFQAAERQQAPRTLMVNGQAIRLSVGVANATLDEVLDLYQGRCQERGGSLAEEVQTLRNGGNALDDITDSWLDPVIRQESGNRGIVACIDTGDETQTTESFAQKVSALGEQMDLSAIGDLRYVYAAEQEGETVFIILWTEGNFPVAEMFPSEGDAPGRDPIGLPRPPQSQRLLNAYETGHPQSMTLYAGSPLSTSAMRTHMREQMEASGWNSLGSGEPSGPTPITDVFERGENMITLSFIETPNAGTQTSILVAR